MDNLWVRDMPSFHYPNDPGPCPDCGKSRPADGPIMCTCSTYRLGYCSCPGADLTQYCTCNGPLPTGNAWHDFKLVPSTTKVVSVCPHCGNDI